VGAGKVVLVNADLSAISAYALKARPPHPRANSACLAVEMWHFHGQSVGHDG
jgi:hypothetical protein